jgi:hypothetical protein
MALLGEIKREATKASAPKTRVNIAAEEDWPQDSEALNKFRYVDPGNKQNCNLNPVVSEGED